MKIHIAGITALSSLLGISAAVAAQSLLVNGDFELPGLPNPSDYLILPNSSTLVPGWVSVDNIPSVPLLVDNFLMRAPYYEFPASQGLYFIYIDNNNGPSPSLNGIYQDFPTLVGQEYRVAFDASTELASGTTGLLGVSAGDTVMHYNLPNVPGYFTQPHVFTGWSSYSFTFNATSSSTRLQFFDEGFQIGGDILNGNSSPLLDNVAVYIVPEPATAMYVMCGIWLVIRRRSLRTDKRCA